MPPISMPTMLHGQRVVLRSLDEEDADDLGALVSANIERLLPWMPWAGDEPLSPAARTTLVRTWQSDHHAGQGFVYGTFLDGSLVGSCGAHTRIGPQALEVGYWIDGTHTGRGLVTDAVATLVDAIFAGGGIERVEIHVDVANLASAGVPRRLGFTLVSSLPHELVAPGEVGIECIWATDADRWASMKADFSGDLA